MNNRIAELVAAEMAEYYDGAYASNDGAKDQLARFAERIVRECADIATHWSPARGAIYHFLGVSNKLPDATKMMGLIPSEWAGLEEPPNSTTDFVEPVVWVNAENLQGLTLGYFGHAEIYTDETQGSIRLYTAPPQCEWVGLTDEEIVKASIGHVEGEHMLPHSFARAIEKLLREKNHD